MNVNLKTLINNIIKRSNNCHLIIKNEDTDSIQSIYNGIYKLIYIGNGTQVISFADHNYEYVYKFCYKDSSTIFNNKIKYSTYETILIDINNDLEKINMINDEIKGEINMIKKEIKEEIKGEMKEEIKGEMKEEIKDNSKGFINLLLAEEILLNNNKWIIYKQRYCKQLKYCSYTILYYILELLKISIKHGYFFSDIYFKNFGYSIVNNKFYISLYDYHNIDKIDDNSKTGFLILNIYLNICSAMNIKMNIINNTETLIKYSYGKDIIDDIYVNFLKKLHKGFKYITIDDFIEIQNYLKDRCKKSINFYKYIDNSLFKNINNIFEFQNENYFKNSKLFELCNIIKSIISYIKPISIKIQNDLIINIKNTNEHDNICICNPLIIYYIIYNNIHKEFILDNILYKEYSILSLPNINICTYMYPQLHICNIPDNNYYWNLVIDNKEHSDSSYDKSEFRKTFKMSIADNIIYLLCKK